MYLYIYRKKMKFGLKYNQIFERITNRADLMNTTILDRLQKRKQITYANRRIFALRKWQFSWF